MLKWIAGLIQSICKIEYLRMIKEEKKITLHSKLLNINNSLQVTFINFKK